MADDYSREIADLALRRAGVALVVNKPSPDAAAQANRVARATGLPAATVDDNLATLARQVELARTRQLLARNPKLAGWAGDTRNAAVAADDMVGMAKSSALWHRLGEVADNVRGAAYAGSIELARGLTNAAKSYIDWQEGADVTANLQRRMFGETIYDPVQRGLDRYNRFQGRAAAARRPSYTSMGRVERGLTQGVESLPGGVAALGATIAGRPDLGLALLGTSTYGNSYEQARGAGLGVGASVRYGAGQGAIEVLTERIPVVRYLHDMKVGSSLFKRVAANMVTEQISEQAATALQDLNEWAVIGSNQDRTFGEYLRERPDAALDTALAVLSMVGGTTLAVEGGRGSARVIDRIARRYEKRADEQRRAMAVSDALNQAMDSAANNKTRTRDPEAFRAFIGLHTTDTSIENVYFPATAAPEYFYRGEEGTTCP